MGFPNLIVEPGFGGFLDLWEKHHSKGSSFPWHEGRQVERQRDCEW